MHVRCLILLAFLLGLAAPAHAGSSAANVRLVSCSPWQEGLGGTVSYEARMRSVPGSERMTVRFDLLERTAGEGFKRVSTGEVNKSRRGVSVFRWEHKVEGLRQGTVYRTKVVYRWLDAGRNEIQTVTRLSEPCKQPGGPPNLRIASVDVSPGAVPGTATYRVVVVNRGDSNARGVGVLLRVDGEVVDESEVIEALGPDESRTVTFSGPVCRSRLRAVVDPKDSIAESDEEDNGRASECV